MASILEAFDKSRAKKLVKVIDRQRRSKLIGKSGIMGDQGPQGLTGPTGLAGAKGLDGNRGVSGLDGKEGKPGIDGITTIITKEILLDQSEIIDNFEELKEELEKLRRNFFGGVHGFAPQGPIVNVIEVSEDTTILGTDLLTTKINVILVQVAGITVTLPTPTADKIVWVQQGFSGTGEFTICNTAEESGVGALMLAHEGQYFSTGGVA